MSVLTHQEIQDLSQLIFDHSGIHLERDKGYLLETRLKPIQQSLGLATMGELHAKARVDVTGNLTKQIVEAMTTNETYFFRDTTPFDLLRNKIIPELIDRRRVKDQNGRVAIRIWSAACSTGQEVYSIAMTLKEMLYDLSRYDIHILGTDISDKVVAQASYGKYNQFEMERGLPAHYRACYFTPLGTDWRIKDEIRSLVQFKTLNLMRPFPELGKYDIIFCRNVAIYFNQADKVRLFQKIAKVLAADGALIVGGSETLTGFSADFEPRHYLKGIFYQLAGSAALQAPGPPPRPPRPAPIPDPPAFPPPLKVQAPEVRPPRNHAAAARTAAPAERTPPPRPQTVPPHPPPTPDVVAEAPVTPPPSVKKSLLAAIKANQDRHTPLLQEKTSPAGPSLLSRLARPKKKSDDE